MSLIVPEYVNIEYILNILKKGSIFINRFGGSDLSYMFGYKNDSNPSIPYYVKILSKDNGYYDTSTDRLVLKNNLEYFFDEFDKTYKSSKVFLEACNTVRAFPQYNSIFKNSKFANYHEMIEMTSYFMQNIFPVFENKKILIISPFIDLIQKQVLVLDKIFPNIKIPNVTFVYLKTYITYYNDDTNDYMDTPHNNFMETVEYYKKEIDKIDFDVAFISAASYTNFIGCHIESLGKTALYIGGILQMYFGIFGDRYIESGLLGRASGFNYEYCILNTHTIDHSRNTRESLNHYLYNEHKYQDVFKNNDIESFSKIIKCRSDSESKKLQFLLFHQHPTPTKYIPSNFDVDYYRDIHVDLHHMNNLQLVVHFVNHGVYEGRAFTPSTM